MAAEMLKYQKYQDIIYKIPGYVAESMKKDLCALLDSTDYRINKSIIKKYLLEIDSMSEKH